MSVVSCNELWDRSGGFTGAADAELTRSWRIIVDSKTDTALTIANQLIGTLPVWLSPHPQNLFYTCRRLTITNQPDSWKHWIATATYSTSPFSQEERDKAEYQNPLDRPARATLEGVSREKYTTKDRNGKALKNSAGDYFPAQVVDDERVLVSLTKNVANRFTEVFAFSNSINSADYTVDGITIKKGCGKIGKFRYSDRQEENGYLFYVLTAEIQVMNDPSEWRIALPDEGFNILKDGEKVKILIPNDQGELEPPSESMPLDGNGALLAPDDPRAGEGVILEWDYYREKDWSQLPF